MSIASSWTLFRIVVSDPPTEWDFWSHARRGMLFDPAKERVATGISAYDRERDARTTARTFPMTGSFVAELRIPNGAPVEIEQTGYRHHFTVWGDAELLMTFVIRVVAI